MIINGSVSYIKLPADVEELLVAGARDESPVRGLTHSFYKYPARFSPSFARAAIQAFTQPGDVCLDPHVGGGTTLVEAIALGRKGIGVDISELAEFVAKIKTTIFEEAELEALADWANRTSASINMRYPSSSLREYESLGYYKHLNDPLRWRLRKAIEQSVHSAVQLSPPRLENFARCAILRDCPMGTGRAEAVAEPR
ncbi:DNA methyltransferase [Bradyrhizobium lupini]|uniref:DNA methyltransferase n=1 Tax=Rhizobium lupini TaxID=136996 RepID=UPI0034C5EB86